MAGMLIIGETKMPNITNLNFKISQIYFFYTEITHAKH